MDLVASVYQATRGCPGGNLWVDLADAAGGGLDPIEHRRGARTTDDRGVSESTLRRTGLAHGTEHPTGDHRSVWRCSRRVLELVQPLAATTGRLLNGLMTALERRL